MSKQKVIVQAVLEQGLSRSEAARRYGVSRAYAAAHVLMLIHDTDVTISDTATGEIIRELTIDPTRDYQSRQRKTPRSEDRGVNDDSTHP